MTKSARVPGINYNEWVSQILNTVYNRFVKTYGGGIRKVPFLQKEGKGQHGY